ncbi:tautomerase family protein [Paraburkholderia bannensis]|uniref:tautomerase family protein n=1 Tax=Paraburkholderia bannensis TaxID=765414 RepID=UPI002ABDC766|nr:Tautomerase enzyme [Paraburkholderia bannensis]
MPITLTVSEGVLSADAEVQTFAALTQALLSVAQLEGNAFMTPNVIGTLNVIPATRVFSAGKPAAAAFVELTLPQIALATPEAKQAFTEKATTILEQAAGGRLARDRIWTNIVYAADGSWGIAGRAHSNADLVEAIQEAAIE